MHSHRLLDPLRSLWLRAERDIGLAHHNHRKGQREIVMHVARMLLLLLSGRQPRDGSSSINQLSSVLLVENLVRGPLREG